MGEHSWGGSLDPEVARVVSLADAGARPVLRRLAALRLQGAGELVAALREFLSTLEEQLRTNEFLDLALARRLAQLCEELIEKSWTSGSRAARHLIQLAVLYLIEDEDAEPDTGSPIGFDDDAEVVELIVRELGCEDLLVGLEEG